MYCPEVCDRSLFAMSKAAGSKLVRYPLERSVGMGEAVSRKWSERDGKLKADLSSEEREFVSNERMVCSIDHHYWLQRYAKIKTKAPGPPRPVVLWESQMALYDMISKMESDKDRKDGILIANLKARQLGMSTCYEMILSHKAFFSAGFTGLLAADEPLQSEYLFSMMERVYDAQPWFLKPSRRFHVKGAQLSFDMLDSEIFVEHGNQRQDIGRGKSIHGAHLSEIEKWKRPQQIDDGLIPALPRLKSTMCFLESTGEFRGSWWHEFFCATMDGDSRFKPFFLPWYAEKETYKSTPPDKWRPDPITVAHAKKVEVDSPSWMSGKKVRLTREQLFFWESTRKSYQKRGELGVFYCEYASSPEEAFRSANSSVFPYEVVESIRAAASMPKQYRIVGPEIDHDALAMKQLKAGRGPKRKG